jgi:hypothetical protein
MAVTELASSTTLERLGASSGRVEALEDELRAEKERRAELVIMARDEGASWRVIARAARRSVARCVAIVSGN